MSKKLEPRPKVKKSLLTIPKVCKILMTVRLLLNILGQRSYIHPDEFFQGLEPIAGHIFNCSDLMRVTWEFKFTEKSEPIRNIFIPYFFYGLPLFLLKCLVNVFSSRFHDNNLISIQTNTLIYYPRIFMTLCSFFIDFTMLKIADYWGLDKQSVLITFATSYVTLTYLTRTFSNSIETILFTFLIYLIVKSIKSQHILNDKLLIASMSPKHKKTVIISSTSPDLIPNSLRDSHRTDLNTKTIMMKRIRLFDIHKCDYLGKKIGIIICIGVFNRPTFLVFALMPTFYWLLHGIENCSSFKQSCAFIWQRLLSLCKLSVPALTLFILIDTIYYMKIHDLSHLIDVVYKKKRFVITPYNFIVYNTNNSNLKSHGSHPFYLHLLVNCPLLFGFNHLILGFIFGKFFFELINYIKFRIRDGMSESSQIKKFKTALLIMYEQMINNRLCFLMFSFTVPLMLLSLIPYQETRFLLPLLIPICLLTSHCLFGSHSYLILQIAWVIFNMIGLFMFGYLHQGGMIASLSNVQKMFTQTANLELDMHVVYYQTYMPPNFLTLAPFSVNLVQKKRYLNEFSRNKQLELKENLEFSTHYDTKPKRKIYDLKRSRDLTDLNKLLTEIKSNYTRNTVIKKDLAVFLITPAVLHSKLFNPEDECSIRNQTDFRFQLQTKFKFHVSFEHLRAHLDLVKCNFKYNDCYLKKCKLKSIFDRLLNSFSLNFYQVIF